MFRPDVTILVDWALKTNFHSVRAVACRPWACLVFRFMTAASSSIGLSPPAARANCNLSPVTESRSVPTRGGKGSSLICHKYFHTSCLPAPAVPMILRFALLQPTRPQHPSLSLCLTLSRSLCVCLPVSLFLSVRLSVSGCLCLSVSLSVCVSVCLSVCLSVSVSVSVSLSLSLSLLMRITQ